MSVSSGYTFNNFFLKPVDCTMSAPTTNTVKGELHEKRMKAEPLNELEKW